MDNQVMAIVGQLYTRVYLLEEENKKLRLALQQKEEEIGLLKENGNEPPRISSK